MIATFLAWPGFGESQGEDGGGGAHTNALQPLCMVVVAIAAITRVAWGCVHAHAALAHLVSEELAFVHICGMGGERWGQVRVWGGLHEGSE